MVLERTFQLLFFRAKESFVQQAVQAIGNTIDTFLTGAEG
jgi:hypothetical protein|tara:strand:+ start:1202 stop:1321 length:120 start_codon:yes stop_codon:yes gene_type:complete